MREAGFFIYIFGSLFYLGPAHGWLRKRALKSTQGTTFSLSNILLDDNSIRLKRILIKYMKIFLRHFFSYLVSYSGLSK